MKNQALRFVFILIFLLSTLFSAEKISAQSGNYDLAAAELINVPESGCFIDTPHIKLVILNQGSNTVAAGSLFTVTLAVNLGGIPEDFVLPTPLGSGDTISYLFNFQPIFTQYGLFQLTGMFFFQGDTSLNNNTVIAYVNHFLSIENFPYTSSFEGQADGWTAESLSGSSWDLGTPAQNILQGAHSGISAWMTKLNNNYDPLSISYLNSPCFDFSNLINPQISFWMNFASQIGHDGTVLEYSVDNGQNWLKANADSTFYTSNQSQGNAAGLLAPWWSGSSNGWTLFKTHLPELGGEPLVKLRFVFSSDSLGNDEGFAIDDFAVSDSLSCNIPNTISEICQDDQVLLSANITGGFSPYTFNWQPSFLFSDSTSAHPVFQSDYSTMISLQLMDVQNNQAECNLYFEVYPSPVLDLGDDTVFLQSTNVVYEAPSGFFNYYWSNGSSGQTLSNINSGNLYALTVSNGYGCTASDSVYIFVLEGILTSGPEQFSVYPQPAHFGLTISGQKPIEAVAVYNLDGICLHEFTFSKSNSLQRILVSHLKAGTYILGIRSGEKETLRKIVIQ